MADDIGDILFDMNCYSGGYDLKGCVNAARRIKEILCDYGIWNVDYTLCK